MLQLCGAGFCYGDRPVLRDIDLTLAPGDHVCLLGNNGAGKSTLLRLCAGILSPQAGRVLLDGAPIAGMVRRDIARRLAYLPQEGGQRFAFSALEVVLMGRYAHQRGPGLDGARVVNRALHLEPDDQPRQPRARAA